MGATGFDPWTKSASFPPNVHDPARLGAPSGTCDTRPYNAGVAQAAGNDDRALRRRVTRLEAIVLELAAASRPSLIPRLMGNEPGASSADVSLEQLPSGRWVAWGGSAVAGGATRAEALSSLGRLLDEYPTIPDEAIAAGQAIAAQLGLGKA
ncbi:MAG TPA: hypothetical protein VKF14_18655 [Candidatus Dormibacteraeota bacterium]|nr:hypothetical protein [Candidatus Dormibacteraeota bacterium]